MVTTIGRVLEQHAEEAAFLWLLRDAAVGAPNYKLKDLAKLDNRVEAHLDGLRIAGDDGWPLIQEQLDEHPEPGEVFAAGVLAFESGNQARIARVLAAGAATPENGRALASAIAWLPDPLATEQASYLLMAESHAHRLAGLASCAVRRQPLGKYLELALRSSHAALRARALKAAGELGVLSALPLVRSALGDQDPACRFYAAWSATLMGGGSAPLNALQDLALMPDRYRTRAVQLAVRRMDPQEARRWLTVLANLPAGARAALVGTGALGLATAVPRLLELMKELPLARLAGEAFEFITGVDLAYDSLDRRPPEGFEAGPTEDAADDDVDPDPDTYLPWPDPDKVAAWWAKQSSAFSRSSRYLLGKPITEGWLLQVLRVGRQRQRAAAALELALLRPGAPLFEVRAPGFRQRVPTG